MTTLTLTQSTTHGCVVLDITGVPVGTTITEIRRTDKNGVRVLTRPAYPIATATYSMTDYDSAFGNVTYRLSVKTGTTTSYVSKTFNNTFDEVFVGHYQVNQAPVKLPHLASHSRAIQTRHVVHDIPGRTAPPIISFRAGNVENGTAELFFLTELAAVQARVLLLATQRVIVRAPSAAPDIIGAVTSATLGHYTPNAEQTRWNIQLGYVREDS